MITLPIISVAVFIAMNMISAAYSAQAQDSHSPDKVKPAPVIPASELRDISARNENLLRMLGQRTRGSNTTNTNVVCREQSYPMFQFTGPLLESDFWADPKAAARMLMLQGELMVNMGQTLIKQGQDMLGEQLPPTPGGAGSGNE